MELIAVPNMKRFIDNLVSFFKLALVVMQKNKPFETGYQEFMNAVRDILSANKKIKAARYRVRHLSYRLHQMERLINDNNPSNYSNGSMVNQIR